MLSGSTVPRPVGLKLAGRATHNARLDPQRITGPYQDGVSFPGPIHIQHLDTGYLTAGAMDEVRFAEVPVAREQIQEVGMLGSGHGVDAHYGRGDWEGHHVIRSDLDPITGGFADSAGLQHEQLEGFPVPAQPRKPRVQILNQWRGRGHSPAHGPGRHIEHVLAAGSSRYQVAAGVVIPKLPGEILAAASDPIATSPGGDSDRVLRRAKTRATAYPRKARKPQERFNSFQSLSTTSPTIAFVA